MQDTHPFGAFVPEKANYLMLGSWPGTEVFSEPDNFDWFYSTKRNQFWPILRWVYGRKLETKSEKMQLLKELNMAVSDVIYACIRAKGTNSDANLANLVYNTEIVGQILQYQPIEKIFFTSRFAEAKYRKYFRPLMENYPEIKLITLPSPSPRFAKLNLQQKVEIYRKYLPKAN